MLWFNFILGFPLFKLIIIHYRAIKKGNKIQTKDKIEPQHIQLVGEDINS